ncbi:hypothetical protein BN14_09637 [Rhizoctonia solani AG-1 IB]|uniref:Uncharacterized protein n=1 Tax=Thanatephorus cucumeris (strain AG1-IB / isolate 7/3/14) TaxID=1108050 RepID=M5C850_THACB|nr:hypothetical protein BN14_09637 [Rhizoctonia solani AG-1 IB]
MEVERAERIQGRNTGRKFADAMKGQDGVIDCCRQVHAHLERLKLNLNLSILEGVNKHMLDDELAKMSPSMSAIYDSAESDTIKRGLCTPGTRQPQIDLLIEWARTPDSGKTCWMNGMAGTGKTTIAYTVKHIIPTIAYQLAKFSLPFRCELVKALESDSNAHNKALRLQYQKLIVEPLSKVKNSLPADFIVVIDALDESESEDSVSQILDQLLSTPSTIPIRFLLSSRPEKQIAHKMAGRLNGHDDTRLVLHNLDRSTVKADIKAYMQAELIQVPLTDAQWPLVVDCCGELFIYASTICRYLKNAHETMSLNEAVNTVTTPGSTHWHERTIDDLYRTLLEAAFGSPGVNDPDKKRMSDILQTVVCAMEPMSVDAIATLLRLGSGDRVSSLLAPLRSVLNVAKDTGLVMTLHASFPDFMLSSDRSTTFHCQPSMCHTAMAEGCLEVIESTEPKFNICALPSSYLLDREVEGLDKKVSESISPVLVYACRYWSAHLELCQHLPKLIERIHHFFVSRVLLWMEIINLTKYIRYATSIIQRAEKWCTEQKVDKKLTGLVRDASQFVSVYANHPVSQSTPHIYVSMLAFWPESRPISAAYMARTSGLVRPTGMAIDRRQLALIATWKVSALGVWSVGLTADGTRLVVPSGNGIEVYDTATGESMISLTDDCAKNIYCVAISGDGSRVAFSQEDGVPYVWEIRNGGAVTQLLAGGISAIYCIAVSYDGTRVACGLENGEVYIQGLDQAADSIGPFKTHTDWVLEVVFSPNGLQLATGSHSSPIRLWDVRTGQPVGEPLGPDIGLVFSLSYSHSGSRLASGIDDNTVQVWDLQTGQSVLGPLLGHSGPVDCLAFSSSGTHIASGSRDYTIRVYDAHTGHTVLGPLQGHTGMVKSVMFSPDATRLFSCSDDGTVRIWNVQDLGTPTASSTAAVLSTVIRSIRYSHSGLRVVSGSHYGSVHVWDVRTGELLLGPLRGHEDSILCVDYSPDDQHIASGSSDKTLRIWDASTGKDAHGPMNGHSDQVNFVRFSADGSLVVSGSDDGTVRTWDVSTGQQTKQLFAGDSGITSVGASPVGHQVVCGSKDGRIRMLNIHEGETLVSPIQAHTNSVISVEFSPDGKRLVSGSKDNSVQIWDTETWKQLAVCGEHDEPHSKGVTCVSFSPSGMYIVSCSYDRTVRIWEGKSGKLILGPLMGHTDCIFGVQFSPNGSQLVSCSFDKTIRFWDVSCIGSELTKNTISVGSETPSSPKSDTGSDWWSLDDDGWVVGSSGRHLVWVPSDLRAYLALPPTSSIIADWGSYRLYRNGWKIGDKWMECYRA